ncbi:MAG TPA: 5-(carboxyamino)imidazole ribonucleotide mutase [Sedimentibacter sp.]|jgi:5-(carboxyamino)imidazole ribonucleotide mutase|nr:5-(carboxyamino)imidazole ribonucleotide mutase [Sedimentibacter sp.]HHZ00608.1 5-(carboxyamino)imidazole ribonucleotide mutase [Tissierellia bacterium]HOK49121.1 5-(carboxyamino)imidazole ribonucleotide mutase [Sedimentibacter sp.]HOW23837.1 5-(carboxyamino)imidazole ribonucleotide mutase [Sedimentibacter sp.]HRC81106.1 5-(carboxyamino)imidazole ribonucleotide mutase [Sedimentibacter sp.]
MKIAIIMGSDSDFPVLEKGYNILKEFGIDVTVKVLSAHRTPDETISFAKSAEENGYEVIIGAAGKAAHLPGILAGCTPVPVIGLPIKSSELDGMDALLSIVQMPPGVPVATVAINGAENAALLAVQILSVKYEELRRKFKEYKKEMAEKVYEKNKKLNDKLMEE